MSNSVWPHRRQPTRLPRPWDSPGKNTGVGCHFLLQCMKVKREREVSQSCLTFSDLMDCSPPGSSIHGIFQARVLEWGAIAFSIEYTCIYIVSIIQFIVLPWWLRWSKNQPAMQETWAQSLGQEDPLEKRWLPTSVFLPGEFYGRKSLAGYSPWGSKGSDMTEWLTIYMLSMYWQSTIYWR